MQMPDKKGLPQPAPALHFGKRDLNDRLRGMRGMAWAYAVLYHTGLTAYGASKRFTHPSRARLNAAGNVVVSNNFYQYLRGDRGPDAGPRGKNRFDLGAAVSRDPRSRAAAFWLDHDLFKVFSPDVAPAWIIERWEAVSEPFLNRLFLIDPEEPSDEDLLDYQGRGLELNSFDEFVSLCAALRAGHMSGWYVHHDGAWRLINAFQVRAAQLEPSFAYIRRPFLRMVREFFYVSIARRRAMSAAFALKHPDGAS